MSFNPAAYNFIEPHNQLARQINERARWLYNALQQFDTDLLNGEGYFKAYFQKHHLGKRLVYSIESSARIIYESVEKTGQPISSLRFADYGAGLGTLFMLAGSLPFKKVVYNDWLPEWKTAAMIICNNLGIQISHYHTGDVDDFMVHIANQGFLLDIIASRNVVEHVYDINRFYECIRQHNQQAVVFSTTTANYHNPVMYVYHQYIHYNYEKKYYKSQRTQAIKKVWPLVDTDQLQQLVRITRGRSGKDFTDAVTRFQQQQTIDPIPHLGSNTCDCESGYWCEHLLSKKVHQQLAKSAGYECSITPGFWDTHYPNGGMNALAKFLNRCIRLLGKRGIIVSPFINIIAHP